jgi:hypothetical protein
VSAIATQPQPQPPASSPAPTAGDEIHLWCCDPDRALCGIDLTGHQDEGDAFPDEWICAMCAVIDNSDMPCGARGCSP